MCSLARESQWTALVKAPRKKRAPNPPRGCGVFQRPTVCRHTCGQPHCCMETWTICLPSRQRVVIPFTTYTHTLKHMYHPSCQISLWVLHKSNTLQARVHRRQKTSSRWKDRDEIVQFKCFEETINCHTHWTTDLSAESATKGVIAVERCKNMLHKDHIYVVKQCMTYICPIMLHDIRMLFKNIYMLFKNIYMLLKRICCLV